MSKIIVIGPLSRDKIIKNGSTYHSIGGAVYYQTAVLSGLGIDNIAVMTLAERDKDLLRNLPKDTNVIPIYTEKTMEFENIYPNHNPNHRLQRANNPNNPVNPVNLINIDFEAANAVLLSPLSPSDIPLDTLKYLSKFEIPIYMGVQGYLRHFENGEVVLKPWNDYKKFLKLVDFLFLDEMEARIILGESGDNCGEIAQNLSRFGPREVIVTKGDRGAIIYSKKGGIGDLYDIPAFIPKKIVDPTGLGDTFMAAYVARKMETDDPADCGTFASLIASLKMEHKGALVADKELIKKELKNLNLKKE